MDLPVNIGIGVALLAIAVFCGWRGAQPPNPAKGPRMIPYRVIMLLAATGVIAMLLRIFHDLGLTPPA